MTLAEYLEEHDITQEDFAFKIGTSSAYVSMLTRGLYWPSKSTMMRIMKASYYSVMPNDFISLEELSQT